MAVHFQEDHQLDPRLLTQGYAVAARQAGARLLEYRPVGTILRENGRAVGVESAASDSTPHRPWWPRAPGRDC
jgi:glycine/D-amino acid oxidase-like deaminating enzyme